MLQNVVKYIITRTIFEAWTIKGKPSERERRKAMDLEPLTGYDCQVTETGILYD